MSGELAKAIADLEEKKALRLTKEKLDRGEEPHSILGEGRKWHGGSRQSICRWRLFPS